MPKTARSTIDITDIEPLLHAVTQATNHYYRSTHSGPEKYIPIRGLSETRDVGFFILGDKRNQSRQQEYALKALCREAGLQVRESDGHWGIAWNSLKPERLQQFVTLIDREAGKVNHKDALALAQSFDVLANGLSPYNVTVLLKLTAEKSEVLPRKKKMSLARMMAKIEGYEEDVAPRAAQMAQAYDDVARRTPEAARAELFDFMAQAAENLPSATKEALERAANTASRG